MADETKETNVAETASETPKKKRDWKGKRLPIVIAAVVAVTVLGVTGWAWRATPGYCGRPVPQHHGQVLRHVRESD